MIRYTLSLCCLLSLVGCPSDPIQETDTADQIDTDPVVQDDADNDTILDVHEGKEDPDEDGKPNMNDRDSDGDSIRDKVEAGDQDLMTLPIDSDGDGLEDYVDTDSDNNCVPDEDEAGKDNGGAIDSDNDGIKDFADPDNDGDGILDIYEIGNECDIVDTDGDGEPDYMDLDSDGDGIGDLFEGGTGPFKPEPDDSDGDGIPDFRDLDSDNDGIPDSEESGVLDIETEPRDTDGDGLYDFQDMDSDGDGLTDADEMNVYHTDPYDFDTDNDGFSDGSEILAETDPLDAESVIDGLYVVVGERTEVEELFSFELRIQRGDLAFVTDTTGSMGGTINAVKTSYTTIMGDAEDQFEDVAGGAAEFDDYHHASMGGGTDKPFRLTKGITTDTSEVTTAVSSWFASGGADGPESTVEAIYQAASGIGYDQNCDGSYDSTDDVPPFLADASDPFGGSATEAYDASLAGAGLRGGFGFRDYSLPIIIYATDNYIRDPEATGVSYNVTPGGCPIDAASSDVVSVLDDLGGYIIGLDVTGGGATSTYGPYPQMLQLAQDTNSYADIDGDGDVDDELVWSLNQSSATFASDFSDFVITAIDQLVSSIKFSDVTLEISGDDYGFVTDIDPESYTGIEPEDVNLDFTLTFRGVVAGTVEDQIFLLTLNVIGDGTTLLDTLDIVVQVPGTSY